MRILRNITFQLWLPNAGVFLTGIILLAVYYPRYQRTLLLEQKQRELTEMARSIANGIELSLDAGNFNGLNKTLHYFSADKNSISVLVLGDPEGAANGVGDLIASFPAGLDLHQFLQDSTEYLQVRTPIKSTAFNGQVCVFEQEAVINELLWTLNFPVYVMLGGSLLVTMLVFYVVALRVGNPIRELNKYATSLIRDEGIRTSRAKDGNELDRLRESLYSLNHSVELERQRNAELMNSLETEVESRTAELSRKNTYLEHAAKILRHDMHSGINTYLPRGINSLIRRLKPEVVEEHSLEAPLRLIKEGLAHTQKVYQGIYEFTNLVKPGSKLELAERNLRDTLLNFLATTSYKDQVVIDDLGVAMISESLFCTALDNLIRNGLKYNDSPTKVVWIRRLDGNVIEVKDNGRGLAEAEFIKFSSTGSRREGQAESGSGLGLGICVAILQEHGFKVTCEKLEPVGSSFKIHMT